MGRFTRFAVRRSVALGGTMPGPKDRGAKVPEDRVDRRTWRRSRWTWRSRRPRIMMSPVMMALDADGDGELSAKEIENAPARLKTLDKDKDGKLSAEELRRPADPAVRPPEVGRGHGRRQRG